VQVAVNPWLIVGLAMALGTIVFIVWAARSGRVATGPRDLAGEGVQAMQLAERYAGEVGNQRAIRRVFEAVAEGEAERRYGQIRDRLAVPAAPPTGGGPGGAP
jgi:hypothetical protein